PGGGSNQEAAVEGPRGGGRLGTEVDRPDDPSALFGVERREAPGPCSDVDPAGLGRRPDRQRLAQIGVPGDRAGGGIEGDYLASLAGGDQKRPRRREVPRQRCVEAVERPGGGECQRGRTVPLLQGGLPLQRLAAEDRPLRAPLGSAREEQRQGEGRQGEDGREPAPGSVASTARRRHLTLPRGARLDGRPPRASSAL